MKKMMLFLLLTLNCYTVNIGNIPNRKPDITAKYVNLAFGLYDYTKKVEHNCIAIEAAKVEYNWVNGLIHFFIGFAYSPRTVEIYCIERKSK